MSKPRVNNFERLVLIEAVVEGLSGRFEFAKFGQVLSGYRDYPDNLQAGYNAGLLSADGACLIQRDRSAYTALDLCASQYICTFMTPTVRFSGKRSGDVSPCGKYCDSGQ